MFAAGALDFGAGLRLVRRRGELMSRITNGAMTAVVGLPVAAIQEALSAGGDPTVGLLMSAAV
ncbi:hypothetical protein [Paractinoplanes rishiriensis]|uniref:hypothetical protein n=1 Tax=Paractinoplanes rishiriensis TaxID=1050105 RepID=UPI001EF1A4AB|nr:hypothetical protein [Actinoplanes rishiriensis]